MGKPLRVLIVEDVPDDAELLLLELRRAGYDPVSEQVETPTAMRAALERGGWDCILSDNSLPQFDAAAALRLLRELDVDLPFIVVSGSIGEDVAVALMKAGAHDYLLKGHLARLGAAVERELREAEHRRERRRAEDNLRRSERRLAEAERLAHLGHWEWTPSDGGTFWSDETYRILGLSRSEVAPALQAFLDRVHPDDRATIHETITQANLGRRSFTFECRIVRPDGSVRLVNDTGEVVYDDSGAPVRFIGTMQDITESKQLEQQFRQAQKMEAVGRLAGGVAHDFNNLLTAIFGYADLLGDDLPEGSPAREDLKEIRTAATRAATLTRQLLAFSRQQVLQPVVLSINDVIKNLQSMLGRLLGEDVELETHLARDLGNAKADPGQIEQVIVNLAVNARDAMPAGGKLTIETSNVDLDDAYAEAHRPVVPGRYVMLAVSDTGTGMDPATKARIFEPFFTTKEAGKGTGLGLATAYGIVKQSGGYIWVYSEPGEGSTFKVYLPRVDAPADEVARTAEAPETLTGTETVLLAEDDDLLRPLARELLTKAGYRVLEAQNAAQALERSANYPDEIQLLLSDVVMPGGGGFQLARQLLAERPRLKVLYMSGYTDEAIVRHGLLERGTNYLQKPFTPAVLARKVRDVLDAK